MVCTSCGTELPAIDDPTERYLTCTQCGTRTDAAFETHQAETLSINEAPELLPRKDLTGQTLGRGTYLVEELIGQGGMGQVYRGKHLRLNKDVAIKIILSDHAADAQYVARFHREGQTLARIKHDGVVCVIDANRDGDMHYLVMEYVAGESGKPTTLRDLMREGPLDPQRAVEIVLDATAALSYIHSQGIIHRDIKPGNFLIDTRGRALVADFGIATSAGIHGENTMTKTGAVLGVLNYMSPEQRINPKRVDARSDVYALGIVLYEILVGEPPAGHFDPPSMARKGVPKALDEIVLKALKSAPEARYQSMEEFAAALRRVRDKLDGKKEGSSFAKKALTAAAMLVGVLVLLFLLIDVDTRRDWLARLTGGGGEELSSPDTETESGDGGGEVARDLEANAFATAVETGDVETASAMLEANEDLLETEWPRPRPALHTAVDGGNVEMLNVLLDYGADTELQEPELGRMALHPAADIGDTDMARGLLNAFAEVNAQDVLKNTPLHLAVLGKRIETIGVLLEYGADPTLENNFLESPLSIAEENSMTDIVALMKEKIAKSTVEIVPPEGELVPETTAPDVVVEQPKPQKPAEEPKPQVAQPVDAAQPADATSRMGIHEAARSGALARVQHLVEREGADVNQAEPRTGNTPLHSAAAGGQPEVVRYLLKKGANKNKKNSSGKYAVEVAAGSRRDEIKTVLTDMSGW